MTQPSLFAGRPRGRKGQLRRYVLETLAAEEATRNSDQLLTVRIWERYCPHLLEWAGPAGDSPATVRLDNVLKLPREDHVKRLRAVIQNEEGRYLPTDPAVRVRRKISEERWRRFLGESTSHLRL